MSEDPWIHRSEYMKCRTCMWFVEKQKGPIDPLASTARPAQKLGRCRKRAPTLNGYPAVFKSDWCGDHKLDENKLGDEQ